MSQLAVGLGVRRDVRKLEKRLRDLDGVDDADARRKRGLTLFALGESLLRLGRQEEAVERFRRSREVLQDFVKQAGVAVIALLREATTLMSMGRDAEALALVEQALGGLLGQKGVSLPQFPDIVPDLWALRVVLLDRVGRTEEIDAAVDGVLDHVDPSATARQREIVVDALLSRVSLARAHGDSGKALKTLEQAAVLCEASPDPAGPADGHAPNFAAMHRKIRLQIEAVTRQQGA